MELLPLLIFLGGIVYTAIASQKDKGNKEKRNIDPGKLGNPSKSKRQQPRGNNQNSEKGFFEQIKDEVERSFGAFDEKPNEQRRQQNQQQRHTESSQRSERSNQQRPEYQRTERNSPQRPVADRSFGRSLEEKARDSKAGKKAMDYYEDKVPTDRTKHRERSQRAKESVFAEGFNRSEAEKRVKGIGRETADEDLSRSPGKAPQVRREKHESTLDKGDFSFDRKAVLNGIIFSEILGKPKSKR
ncbi:hypothetical protein [Salinicoccus sp. HZC-1]|uniref:hypothetical protein n=1 Tax=Salinicoccus sp. HZC-1 TaxID=3385497 RepID=UPI00398B36F7